MNHSRDISPGDIVKLTCGGPMLIVIQITKPGRATDIAGTSDVVVWWRLSDGKPQIDELDSRCVQHVKKKPAPRRRPR